MNRISWSERIFRFAGTALPLDRVSGIVLEPCDEINFLGCPIAEQFVVVITAIHHDDGAGVERKGIGHFHVATPGFGDQDVARQIIVVVQQHVSLNAALGPAELRPRKHLDAQADRCRIERQQLVFKTELSLAQPQALFLAKPPQERVKQFLVEFRRSIFVGLRQRGFIRSRPDSQVHQFAHTTGKPVADLAQGIGVSQLAKQHCHQLGSTSETFGSPLRAVLFHQRRKLKTRKMLKQLIEQTHCR